MLKRLNALGRPQFSTSTVYLVGAGPGDAYLLTVKVLNVLSRADVIVHDLLVGANVLDRARRDAIRIYAGKSAGHHTMTQEEINALLLQHARAGRTVVRLKGGDPFLFACGGEETDSLRRYGIAVEVVPGVSSAFPCAARVGILLTHRDLASGVRFVSANPKPGGESPDWAALAQGTDTRVVFMGVAEVKRVASNLIAHGLTPETPAAVIECGTLPDERILTGPLVNLAGMIARTGVKAPAILILGETVRLSPTRAELALRAATT
jgi:uroporphyrin-III C-methyltransferase/precorrin-2 dehydrogenase/sirohydrochlorin ferrochelatase